MFAKKQISIFSFSLIGSLFITTYGLMENLITELNPFMSLLFSFNYIFAWIFCLGAIFFIAFVNHQVDRRNRREDWHDLAYWFLAMIFLFNFLREFVFLLLI